MLALLRLERVCCLKTRYAEESSIARVEGVYSSSNRWCFFMKHAAYVEQTGSRRMHAAYVEQMGSRRMHAAYREQLGSRQSTARQQSSQPQPSRDRPGRSAMCQPPSFSCVKSQAASGALLFWGRGGGGRGHQYDWIV